MRIKRKAPDRLSGERVREMMLLPGWKIVQQRTRVMIEKCVQALIETPDPIESAKLRGQIQAFRTALQIPDIIVAESTKEVSRELSSRPEED